MTRSRLLGFSVLMNLVLIGAAGYVLVQKPGAWRDHSEVQPSDSTVAKEVGTSSQATPQPAAAPFQWSQLESANYATYISNLRAVGCPEQTVRDIITADAASQNLTAVQKNMVASLLNQPSANPGGRKGASPGSAAIPATGGNSESQTLQGNSSQGGSSTVASAGSHAVTGENQTGAASPQAQSESVTESSGLSPSASTHGSAVAQPTANAANNPSDTASDQSSQKALNAAYDLYRAQYGWSAFNSAQIERVVRARQGEK